MQSAKLPTTTPNQQKMRRQAYGLLLIALIMSGFGVYLVAAGALPTQYNLVLGEPVPAIVAPYEITVFQLNLAAPRFMVGHPEQPVLFVSERGAGRVLALRDEDGDLQADSPQIIAENLAAPTGLAFYDDWLYIAQANEVLRIRLDADLQELERETIIADLPVGKNSNEVESNQHALLIHEAELYISIGANCAACQQNDSRNATVMVYALDGSNERVFARGLYQVLGLAVNPITREIWATNQGRPLLDEPAAETLYILQNADHAGFPECINGEQLAPEFDAPNACENVLQPLRKLEPQANITNLMFLNGTAIPEAYQGDLLFALHGGVIDDGQDGVQSQIGIFRWEIDGAGNLTGDYAPFVEGFWLSEEPGDYLGRTFGLAMLVDGRVFISDDASGAIYQLRWVD